MKLETGVTYYVESDRDDTVLLAMDAKARAGVVEWFDTSRDRMFKPLSVEETNDSFSFTTKDARYTLRRLTVEIYDRKVMGKVDGHPKFFDTEAVQRFYRSFPR